MKKQTQKQRILSDLLQGLHINMLNDVVRYGTSCRNRIGELRAEGYPIEGYTPEGKRHMNYFLPANFLKQYHSERVA